MKRSKLIASVTSLLILGIASSAMAAPFSFKNYQADYVLKYDGIPFGRSTTNLNITPSHYYQLCINNKTTLPFLHGSVTECSQGVILKNQIKPLQYNYDYNRNGVHKKIQINFNWKKMMAIMSIDKSTWHMKIPENTQDKISYQLLLRQGLANGKAFFSFPIADGGKLKTYQFKVIKNEKNLIELERLPMADKENVVLWFMKNNQYLISKVQQNKHIADVGTAELKSVDWDAHV